MTLELWAGLVKNISAVATAAFGAYGLGTDTRDKSGHLTRAGWIGLIGIFVGTAMTITSQTIESKLSSAAAAQQQRETNSIIRGITPLKNVSISFSIDIAKDMEFRAYSSRLADAAPAIVAGRLPQSAAFVSSSDHAGPRTITIPSGSPLEPQDIPSEAVAAAVVGYPELVFALYQPQPTSQDACTAYTSSGLIRNGSRPDLIIDALAGAESKSESLIELTYDLHARKFRVEVTELAIDLTRETEATGNIVSELDFQNAGMCAKIGTTMVEPNMSTSQLAELKKIRRASTISFLTVRVGNRSLHIPHAALTRQIVDGETFIYYLFPADLNSINPAFTNMK